MHLVDLDEVIRAARGGDPDARSSLARWMFAELSRFFLKCFEHEDTAELIQDTIEVVFKKLHKFEPSDPDSFRRYVIKIAAIEAMAKSRKRHRELARKRGCGP